MSYTLSRTGAEIDNKIKDVYGGIHTHDNSTSQTIPTGTTYTKIINFSENNDSSNVTSDYSNNQIEIDLDGKYRIAGSFSMETDTNNVTGYAAVFINGVEYDEVHWERKIQTAGDRGNASFTGNGIDLSDGDIVDVRLRHDNGSSVDFTFVYMNFNLTREGL